MLEGTPDDGDRIRRRSRRPRTGARRCRRRPRAIATRRSAGSAPWVRRPAAGPTGRPSWRRSARRRRRRRPGPRRRCVPGRAAEPPGAHPPRHLVVRRDDDALAYVTGEVGELVEVRHGRPPWTVRSRSSARAARPRARRALTVPSGTPRVSATSATGRSARWCRAMASRWAAGSRRSAAISARRSSGRSAYASVGDQRGDQVRPAEHPPPAAAGHVDGHGAQPGLGVVGLVEGAAPRGRPGERLHHDVLGLRGVAGDADELADQARVRRGVHLAQPSLVHRASSCPQLCDLWAAHEVASMP